MARSLHRRHVVDAVADHGDVGAVAGQRCDQGTLVVGGEPREHRRLARHVRQLGGVLGQVGPLPGRAGHANAGPGGDGRHRRRRVAGHHLHVDVLAVEEGDRVGGVVAQSLLQHHQRQRLDPGRAATAVGRGHHLLGPPEGKHPAALLLVSRHLGRQPAGQQHVRRAQHQPAVLAADAAPLPTGRERHLLQRRRGRAGQAGGDGVQRRVAGLGAGRVAGHERPDVLL
jgi:hypothetical protein